MFLNNQAKSSWSKRSNGDRGQAAVEFTLMAPILLMIILLAVDFGWLLKNWLVITNASREAARCAALNASQKCTLNGVVATPEEVVIDRLRRGLGVSSLTDIFSSTPTYDIHYIDMDGDGFIKALNDSVVVCIKADNNYITPLLPFLSMVTGGAALPNPLPLKARTEMRLQNEPDIPLVPNATGGQACVFP